MAEILTAGHRVRLPRRLLEEPRRPGWIRDSPRAARLAVVAVCVGAFMGQLDASIVTVAIPQISTDLRAHLAATAWASLSYLVVLVGTVAAIGRWADMVGRKLVYTYGFLLFTLASLGCGLAGSLRVLIAMRVLQAVGAAMLQANSVALIRTSVSGRALPRAIGLQAAAQALGLAAGPAVGGLLLDVAGWRWVFWVNLPAGLVGISLAILLLPRTRERAERTRFDWRGLMTLMIASAAMLIALSAITAQPKRLVVGLLAVSVVSSWLFVRRQRRTPAPLIDLTLFGSRTFSAGICSALLGYLVLFGLMFVVALHEHQAHRLTEGQAGAALSVLPIALGCAAPLAARLAHRFDPALIAGGAMAVTALACLGLLIAEHSTVVLVAALSVAGAALGIFTASNNAMIAAAGGRHQAGMVGGLLNMTRGLGTALGVSVASAAYTLATRGHGFQVSVATLVVVSAFAALTSAAPLGLPLGLHRRRPDRPDRPVATG